MENKKVQLSLMGHINRSNDPGPKYRDAFGTKEWASSNVNFAKGCTHNCRYCYAKRMALRFHRISNPDEWARMEILPEKVNKRYGKRKGRVMIPTSHDITPQIIEEAIVVLRKLLESGNELLITTKPHLECIKRICREFEDYNDRILFRFTITSDDDEILKYWEPGAPSFRERWDSLVYAYNHGFRTSVSCEPYLSSPSILYLGLLTHISDTFWVGQFSYLPPAPSPDDYEKYYAPLYEITSDKYIVHMYETLRLYPDSREKIRFKESVRKRLIALGVWKG